MTRCPLAGFLTGLLLCVAFSAAAVPQGYQVVPHEVLPIVSTLAPLATTNPNTVLHISVSLRPADQRAFEAFVDSVSDPASPEYRHFITPEEVGIRFGAPKQDVDSVDEYLKQHGMKVTLVALNRMAILADATVAQVEAAFHTKICDFVGPDRRGGGMLSFHANTLSPSVPDAIAPAILDISGLEDYGRPKPASTTLLNPPLTRVLYNGNPMYLAGYQGSGRTIAISNWDGFRLTNVPLYYATYSLPTPPGGVGSNVSVVTINGGAQQGMAQGEGDLDIQMELGMAPLANLIVYDDAPTEADPIALLTREANDNLADLISESWGWSVTDSAAAGAHNQHMALSAQGITYMAASGDSGTAWLPSWPYPPTDPDVLMVGGTTATVSDTGVRQSEVGWSGSGGGWVVNTWAFNKLPSWQKGTGVPTNINYRLIPDVALHASGSPGAYAFYMNGSLSTGFVGTSFASPVLAGSLAVAQERIISLGGLPPDGNGKRRFGRIADLFYSQNGRTDVWYDITSGNNGTLPNGQSSSCKTKWDTVTGWGVLNFTGFVASQATIGTTATTTTESNTTGQVGGNAVLLTASLVKTSGSVPLSGRRIGFTLNGVVAGSGVTNASGVATAYATIPESLGTGTFPIQAIFGGDTTYATSSGSATLTVIKADTALNVTNQNASHGQHLALTATLIRISDGSPLGGKQVSFQLDGVSLATVFTDGDGLASLNYSVSDSLALGPHTIQTSFAGSNLYNPGTGTGTLTVVLGDTQTTPLDTSGSYGQTVTLNASLIRLADSTVIAGRTVNFYVSGSQVGSGTTNTSGLASCSYTISGSLPAGANTFTATFPGDTFYNSSSGSGALTVNTTSTTTTAGNASGAYGQSISLTATLKRSTDNSGVSGKTVAFTVDGNSTGIATTDGSGVATLPYVVATSLATGSHAIHAGFAGDSQYGASSANATLTVSKASTALAVGNAAGDQGASVNLIATLTRSTDGATLGGETVSFTVDGSSAGSATTDGAGVATLSYSIPSGMATGTHSIGAGFGGDALYLASSGSGTLTVTPGTSTVSGVIDLQDIISPAGQTTTMEFRTPGTTTVLYSTSITLDGSGNYTATGVPHGTYDVACKFVNWLRQVLPSVDVTQTSVTGVDFSLPAGDANNDNLVNLLDLSTVLADFGMSGTPPIDGDLNWSGAVDLIDLSTVLANFGSSGAP